MKKNAMVPVIGLAALAVTLAGLWAAVVQVAPVPLPLSEWMPGGALLYLESSDFATQLRDWNRSEVKSEWLASKNHEAFLTTRLVLKLRDMFGEFSSASGFAPNLDELETVSGTDTALALYDIGKLEFLYISRLPAAQLGQNVLTRVRAGYQTRTAAGMTYFVRQSGERTAAFATAGEYVVVSTREDLLFGALERIQGNAGGGSVNGETWYRDAVQALPADAGRPVAFRLVMDFANVVATPYFRSYWIQRNTADLAGYYSVLSQMTRNGDSIEENRVLLRADAAQIASNESATVELQRYIPDEVGLFRLWDTPSPEFALDLVQQKFFAAGAGASTGVRYAPTVNLDSTAGSSTDLQTRIDAAPRPSLAGGLNLAPLKVLLDAARLEAVLHLESSIAVNDVNYVRSDAAVALKAASPWNAAGIRSALTSAVESYQSVGNIGLQWRNVVSGTYTLSQWDGLLPLTIYVDGEMLWIARTPGLLSAALNHSGSAAPLRQPGTYLARYSHRAELSPYLMLMRMLDLADPSSYSGFFSENIGSLASALDVIESVSVTVTDSGPVRREAVRYVVDSTPSQ